MTITQKIIAKFMDIVGKKDTKRLASQSAPEKIVTLTDIPYINDGNPAHLLDIYYPEGTTEKRPVIFDIHGGAWVYGTKEINKYFCMNLAAEGFTVININYRLITESRYPSQLQDIYAALNFIAENADKYYCDMDNFFIMGDSAGGHLASTVMALQNNAKQEEEWGLKTDVNIKAGSLICAVFELGSFVKFRNPVGRAFGEYFIGKDYFASPMMPKLSLSGVYNGKMPPMFLNTSMQDFMRGQNLKAMKFFEEKGEYYEYHIQEKVKGKKFEHVYNILYPHYEESKLVNKKITDFFKKYIG